MKKQTQRNDSMQRNEKENKIITAERKRKTKKKT